MLIQDYLRAKMRQIHFTLWARRKRHIYCVRFFWISSL